MVRPAALDRQAEALASLEASTSSLYDDLAHVRGTMDALAGRLEALHHDTAALLDACRDDGEARARLAAVTGARLNADGIRLEGPPSARLQVRRLTSGAPVDVPFGSRMGLTCLASTAPDVRALWDHLTAREAACTDDRLRGAPATILEMTGATVSMPGGHGLTVALDGARERPVAPDMAVPAYPLVAVPKLTHHFSARKLRNVGHWLLDGLPQVAALVDLAPDALFLLPPSLKGVHRATLALLGVPESQTLAWDGHRLACERLLVLEDDGRAGGGRPLSALLAMRQRLAHRAGLPDQPGTGRVYVARRDAKPHRRWATNEPDVEALFASRGFTIVAMNACPLPDQLRIFGRAGVIAGISGAGLADIVFAPPGAHVITLVSDDLMRWYAEEGQSRALWMHPAATGDGELARLGDSPRFYGHVAAALGQTSHYFVGPDQVPLDQLARFLDDVLPRVAS